MKKNINFLKKINSTYISFILDDIVWFRIYLKTDSIEIYTITGTNLEERLQEIKSLTGVIDIDTLQQNKEQREKKRGFLRFFIHNNDDFLNTKKIVDYYLDNLEEEKKKTKKGYYYEKNNN